jgi:hypothetical protein
MITTAAVFIGLIILVVLYIVGFSIFLNVMARNHDH